MKEKLKWKSNISLTTEKDERSDRSKYLKTKCLKIFIDLVKHKNLQSQRASPTHYKQYK